MPLLFALSKPMQPHQKRPTVNRKGIPVLSQCTYGLHTTLCARLWWSWAESNRRPEHFWFYFIQPYFSILPVSGAPDYPRKVCVRLLRIYALSGK